MNRHLNMRRILSGCLWLLLLLAACSPPAAPDKPPEIRYGGDSCNECSMIIDDARFAAAYVTTTGDVRRFDDIGDMLVYDQQRRDEVHIYWVHDYTGGDWVNAQEAVFVRSPNLTTPMAWGLAAFRDPVAAEAFALAHEGHLTNFQDLMSGVATGALDPNTLSAHTQAAPAGDHEHKTGAEAEEMNHEHAESGQK